MPPSPESIQIEKLINDFIKGDQRIDSFHDLRIVGEKTYGNLLFDFVVKRDLKTTEKNEIKKSILKKISEINPAVKDIQIKYERSYL